MKQAALALFTPHASRLTPRASRLTPPALGTKCKRRGAKIFLKTGLDKSEFFWLSQWRNVCEFSEPMCLPLVRGTSAPAHQRTSAISSGILSAGQMLFPAGHNSLPCGQAFVRHNQNLFPHEPNFPPHSKSFFHHGQNFFRAAEKSRRHGKDSRRSGQGFVHRGKGCFRHGQTFVRQGQGYFPPGNHRQPAAKGLVFEQFNQFRPHSDPQPSTLN